MNRDQAYTLVRQTFTHKFDKNLFFNFSQNLLNHLDESKAASWNSQYVKDAFKEHIQCYERLGTYTSPEKDQLDVLIVHLTSESKLERARTAIRNFVADHLKTRDEKDAALVAFVSPSETTWRFSYVKMEYATVEKDSGQVGVETHLTPARRFSYIVGEGESCHTAQTRFLDLLQDTKTDPSLTDIEEAFSVEAVTKEFFTEYTKLFEKIHEALNKLVVKEKTICDEFTAKGVDTVDFAKKLMGQIVFLYFLQKKGWLGVGKGQDWGYGPRDFLRRMANSEYCKYDNFFNDVLEPLFYDTLASDRGHEAWCNRFKCRLPFLNGGLFEPPGGYDWRKADIPLPNKLFTNSEYVEESITGTGVLDVFDRYNFTVNEAEPLEKEVAIDPEMLGKVFENLIEENRRRGLGAYYTPREIVHYMCQESLINYLNTAINKDNETVPRTDIETLIHLGEQISHYESVDTKYPIKMPESIEKHARLIDDKLAMITVCDPAVGSGAFPVGMMTEIVRGRCALTPYFNDVHERTPYHFKRHAIQNCLYGVDIDAGAVEIAKLRLWLSLVVDEEDVKQIKPLPNLDYKIVPGNSLLGVERNLFTNELFGQLEDLKPLYFDETDPTKKAAFKNEIDGLIHQLTNDKQTFDFEIYFSEVFHRYGGFDIVIANPPYETTRSQGIGSAFKNYLGANYETAEDKYDYYTFFIEKSSKVARLGGHICLITPSTYLTKPLSRKIRKYLLEKVEIVRIDEFKGLVFETVVPTAVLLFTNCVADDEHMINIAYDINSISDFLNKNFMRKSTAQKTFNRAPYYYMSLYADERYFCLFDTLCKQEKVVKLGELAEIYNGIQTGNDKKFVSYEKKSAKWQEVITGSDIQAYYKRWGGKYVYYVPEVLHSNTRKDIFKTPTKIIIRQTADRIIAAYDNESYLTMASTFIIKQFRELISYKSLLAILNSNLFLYLYRNLNNEEGRVLPQIKKMHIFDLPIKIQFEEGRLVRTADQILTITKGEDYLSSAVKQTRVQEYKRQIDQLVYRLYGLTPEEIAIVEESTRVK